MGRLDKSPKNLLKLYSDMYQLRLFEDITAEKYKSGEIVGGGIVSFLRYWNVYYGTHTCGRWRTDHQLTKGGNIL